MTDTPERELIEHDHVAEACERLRDRDWPSFTPDQIVHVRIGDIRALLSRVDKLDLLEERAKRVVEECERDEAQGYRSYTRRYVIEMLSPALNRSAS